MIFNALCDTSPAKEMFMKIAAILLSVLFASIGSAQAQSYHVTPGVKRLICKAAGKVDLIDSLFLTETTVRGQLCGSYTRSQSPMPNSSVQFCIKGELLGEENILSSDANRYGVSRIVLSYVQGKGFILKDEFECDWNHEEKCLPGTTVEAEEVMDCHVSTLKY